MKFTVPRIWQEPTNHSSDCYFCLVDPSKHRAGKNASATRYPDIPPSIAPGSHSAQFPVPTPSLLPKKIKIPDESNTIKNGQDTSDNKDYITSRRCHLKGIHSRLDTNRTGAEGLSFYYPRLLHCLDQMLAVMSLSQHRVSSPKTVRSRAPCGARCIGHAVSTWSAVCSEAPHSQFGEGARPHLCMDEWNRPTPVRRRLSLTQAAWGKPIPTGLALLLGTKGWSLEAFLQYSAFHL